MVKATYTTRGASENHLWHLYFLCTFPGPSSASHDPVCHQKPTAWQPSKRNLPICSHPASQSGRKTKQHKLKLQFKTHQLWSFRRYYLLEVVFLKSHFWVRVPLKINDLSPDKIISAFVMESEIKVTLSFSGGSSHARIALRARLTCTWCRTRRGLTTSLPRPRWRGWHGSLNEKLPGKALTFRGLSGWRAETNNPAASAPLTNCRHTNAFTRHGFPDWIKSFARG